MKTALRTPKGTLVRMLQSACNAKAVCSVLIISLTPVAMPAN